MGDAAAEGDVGAGVFAADIEGLRRIELGLVVIGGGGCCVRRTIQATRSGEVGALPGERDLSRSRPPTPSCMNRSCQRHTQVLDLPVSAMIADVH